jgi:dsRNA-specific ribonuclease
VFSHRPLFLNISLDAPKCLGDIVESVFGSVFVDAGLDAAFSAVNRVLCPVLEALRITFAHLHHDEMDSKVRSLINPKQYIHELVGEFEKMNSKCAHAYHHSRVD